MITKPEKLESYANEIRIQTRNVFTSAKFHLFLFFIFWVIFYLYLGRDGSLYEGVKRNHYSVKNGITPDEVVVIINLLLTYFIALGSVVLYRRYIQKFFLRIKCAKCANGVKKYIDLSQADDENVVIKGNAKFLIDSNNKTINSIGNVWFFCDVCNGAVLYETNKSFYQLFKTKYTEKFQLAVDILKKWDINKLPNRKKFNKLIDIKYSENEFITTQKIECVKCGNLTKKNNKALCSHCSENLILKMFLWIPLCLLLTWFCGYFLLATTLFGLFRATISPIYPTVQCNLSKATSRWVEGTTTDKNGMSHTTFSEYKYVEYTFMIRGKEYVSDNVSYSDFSDGRYLGNKTYSQGDRVTVYYNPLYPNDCILQPGLSNSKFLFLWLFLGGLFAIPNYFLIKWLLPIKKSIYKNVLLGKLNNLKKYIADGGNVNATDTTGTTLLMLAIIGNNAKCAKFLLENNANLKIEDEYDKTAEDYVKEKGFKDLQTFIK